MIDTVEDYISGNITVDQALGKLRYTSPNNQICILSQSLLDKYLRLLIASGLMIYEKGGRYERASALEKGRPDYYATSGAFADIPGACACHLL